MTPHALAQRRRVLFTMLTTLGYRYPLSREPAVIAGSASTSVAGLASATWSQGWRTSSMTSS